jgi:hypothetical protein
MPSAPHAVVDPLDDLPSVPVLDLRARIEAALAGTAIDREGLDTEPPLLDAIEELSTINAAFHTESVGLLTASVGINKPHEEPTSDGPSLERDRDVLREIARFRVVSFAHLRRFLFSNRSPAVVTRRMQALRRAGFISTWEDRLPKGGHPRHALLTDKGLAWAIATLRQASIGTGHEQLVQFMLRARTRKPLVLLPNTAPPFLPHQVETNLLTATLRAAPRLGITWASTWHRPFPNEFRDVGLPQPDAVLVATIAGRSQLVFLEHDRGQEAPATFAERKTARYQLLVDLGLTRELFGFDAFTVLVTITDPTHARPFDRLRALQAVSAAAPMMRFSLASWVLAHPDGAVWFMPETPVESTTADPAVHGGLLTALPNLERTPA